MWRGTNQAGLHSSKTFEQFFAVWQHSTPACSIWISSGSLHRGFIPLQKHSLELKQKFNHISKLNSGKAFLNFYLTAKTPNRICTILPFHKKKTIMVKLAIIQYWIKSLCLIQTLPQLIHTRLWIYLPQMEATSLQKMCPHFFYLVVDRNKLETEDYMARGWFHLVPITWLKK